MGADANEGVEVAVSASDTNVYVIRLFDPVYFYAQYISDDTSVATISAPINGIKYIVFRVPIPYDGPTGAIYLFAVGGSSFLEQLSYEGSVSSGETDIGVLEDGTGPDTFSLQRRTGCAVWDMPRFNTFGAANVGTSACPTKMPTQAPTKMPTKSPTKIPTRAPTKMPTRAPTKIPTKMPTKVPTKEPTDSPSTSPSFRPVKAPVNVPVPVTVPIPVAPTAPITPPVTVPTAPITPPMTVPTAPVTPPMTVPTKAPVKVPTKAPVKVNTTAPVVVPTDAPVREPCGILNLSIICFNGCGIFGRLIGLCN